MKIFDKFNYKQIITLVLLFFAMFIFSNSSINKTVFCFLYPLAFALVYNGIYPIYVCGTYFAASIIHGFNFYNLINTSVVLSMLIILHLVVRFTKKQKIYVLLLFVAFSRVSHIYFLCSNLSNIIYALVDLIIGLAFAYILSQLVFAFSSRGVQMLTKKEKLFFYMSLIPVFAGLSGITILGFNLSKLIVVFVLLLASKIFDQKSLVVSVFASIGIILQNFSIEFVPICYIICGLGTIIKQNKFLLAGVVALFDAVILAICAEAIIYLVPTIVACLCYILIPEKILINASQYIFGEKKSIISLYLIEKRQQDAKNKLMTMALTFAEMQKCYRSLMINSSDETQKVSYLASEIKNNICSNCINYMHCYEGKNMLYEIEKLLGMSLQKEKVNMFDVSNLLASYCVKLNSIISAVNSSATEYKLQIQKNKEDEEGKLAISLQLAGTEKIFKELGENFTQNSKINIKKAAIIKDLAIKNNIVCKECIVFEDNFGVAEIFMVVRNIDAVNPEISNVCSKAYPIRFERADCVLTKYAGWSMVRLVPMQKFELQCGVASRAKEIGDKSGDSYVFTKLNNGKYLIAICDGMGHGEVANQISMSAISLMQSLYNCGLSSALIMDSLNSLILPAGKGFTTVDATIVDTSSGETNFVKIGSTISIVKGKETSKIIEVESLPLGAVETTMPNYKLCRLSAGDIVVLASDGVVDSFGQNAFYDFVNNERAINMQIFAEAILEEATARNSVHKDDMTVIAYKLAEKR